MTEKSIWGRLFGKPDAKPSEPAKQPPAAGAAAGDPATPPAPPAASPAGAPIFDMKPATAKARPAVKPAPAAATPRATQSRTHSATARPEPAQLPDHVRARIREHYFRSRFPDVPLPAPGSNDATAIIKAARLYFEDGDTARAVELLRQTADLLPRLERVLLAKLELHYLDHNEVAFTETARIFAERFPSSTEWPSVARLGWRLAPSEALFANARPAKVARDDQYGAWPEVPNWIDAPWDLTGEVLAVELRGRILAAGHTCGIVS